MVRETHSVFTPASVVHVRLISQNCQEIALYRVVGQRDVPIGCTHSGATWRLGEQAPASSELPQAIRAACADASVVSIQLEVHDEHAT